MKSFAESIYLKLPVWMQSLLINAKGFSIERIRHGGYYKEFLEEVSGRQNWNGELFSNHQWREVHKILDLAYNHVPNYYKRFREAGVSPDRIHSLEDVALLPYLEKSEIRRDPLAFVDSRVNRKELLILHTTGTTGTPLRIYTNRTARQWNYAFFDAYVTSLGINVGSNRATFGGRIIAHPMQNRPPFWRYSFFQKNLLFSSYHMTDKNLPFYFDKLKEYQPELIDSYPSSLYTLSKYIIEYKKAGQIRPKGIVTSAATLFDEQRTVIEEAFQCKVKDQYGCAEMCIFVGQCKEGKYHYRPDYSLIEIIKENGQIAKPGEMGEIVCTGFINQVMPLIRYKIGDVGIMSSETCRCGLDTPYFDKILGRVDDFILTPDGRYVGRLSPVLKGFPVKEAQYIQKRIDLVVVKLVKDSHFDSQTSKQLIKEIQKRLGYSISIELEFVDELPRGPGGKLRTVISELSSGFKATGGKTMDLTVRT